MAEQPQDALMILRRKQLEARMGIARSTIYDRLNPRSPRFDPSFPQPVKIGGCTCWIASEVQAYLEEKVRESRCRDCV